jgi:two-component system NtrC family response regulator
MDIANNPKVLVVDDEPGLRMMAKAVLSNDGWQVTEAESGERALEVLAGLGPDDLPDVVLLDMRMPGMDGLETLGRIKQLASGVPVVMLTAYGTVDSAVEAMKQGAYDYLTKPADNEELKTVLAKARDYRLLITENQELRRKIDETGKGRELIGASPGMHRVKDLIAQAGPSEAHVLVTGESGTGKELVAEALHQASQRSGGPLVKVNCAALPSELLESELFGYKKGAFTGAAKDKPGRFQTASGGTLLLDEIGDMPLSLQAKLLRVLQERQVEPLGANMPEPADARIIAATHKKLSNEVKAGRFREDLFFRLNVLEIRIPALRERLDDLPLLAAHLIERLSEKNKKNVRRVCPRFLEALSRYDWPGNVRELENVLERAIILSRSETLDTEDLPPHLADKAPASPETSNGDSGAAPSLDEAEKQAIVRALKAHGGHRERTAEALGVSRRTLQYKLKKYGLKSRG